VGASPRQASCSSGVAVGAMRRDSKLALVFHFETSLDDLSLRSDVTSSIKILSLVHRWLADSIARAYVHTGISFGPRNSHACVHHGTTENVLFRKQTLWTLKNVKRQIFSVFTDLCGSFFEVFHPDLHGFFVWQLVKPRFLEWKESTVEVIHVPTP